MAVARQARSADALPSCMLLTADGSAAGEGGPVDTSARSGSSRRAGDARWQDLHHADRTYRHGSTSEGAGSPQRCPTPGADTSCGARGVRRIRHRSRLGIRLCDGIEERHPGGWCPATTPGGTTATPCGGDSRRSAPSADATATAAEPHGRLAAGQRRRTHSVCGQVPRRALPPPCRP